MNTNPFQTVKGTKKPKTYTNDSILEALRDLSGGVGKTVSRDVASKVATDAFASMLGATPQKGELKPNQSVQFADHVTQPEPREAMRPPFLRPERARVSQPIVKEDQAQLAQQIEAIRQELKAIAASIQSLNTEIGKAVAEVPVNPGVYHKNFFERLRSVLAILREQIDDSRTWLALSAAKKQKKLGYWGMFKKHGTSFGLSNERSLATSAG